MKRYYPAAKIINDTSEHLGRYGKVMALQDSVVTVGIDFDSILPAYFGDHKSIQLKAGAEFYGPFSVVVLDSGTVIVYRL